MLVSKSQHQIDIENKIDNYIRNIQVLVALSSVFSEYNGDSTIGKKLKFKQEDGHITPDLVTEMKIDSNGLGILSESKVSLPRKEDYWIEYFDQLKKYDKQLKGWSSNIQSHDLIFVTDGLYTRKFFEFIEKTATAQNYHFTHNLAILYSHREDKINSFIDLRKDCGDNLSHSDLSSRLHYGIRIALKNIVRDVEDIKYYDERPPFIYTMETMWNFVFPSKIAVEDYSKQKTTSAIPLMVNVEKVLDEMRERFAPPSNSTVIKKDWIKEALDQFVNLGLARQLDKAGNDYEIYFRKRLGKEHSTRNYLLNLFFKDKYNKEDSDQTKIDEFISNQ